MPSRCWALPNTWARNNTTNQTTNCTAEELCHQIPSCRWALPNTRTRINSKRFQAIIHTRLPPVAKNIPPPCIQPNCGHYHRVIALDGLTKGGEGLCDGGEVPPPLKP
eukprot:Gb_28379 [translate_table: standard]